MHFLKTLLIILTIVVVLARGSKVDWRNWNITFYEDKIVCKKIDHDKTSNNKIGVDIPKDYKSFFPKCCPRSQIYLNYSCQDSQNSMKKFKMKTSIMCNNVLLETDDVFEPKNIIYGDPCMDGGYMLESKDVFVVSLDGNLYIKNNAGRYDLYDSKQYCMETDNDTLRVLVCFDTQRILYIYAAVELISVVFLIVTLVVYTFVKNLRTVHGLALRYHVSCLIVAFSVLAAVQLAGGREIPDWMCILAGYVIELSFLAYFFWLTVMCIETYKSITTENNEKSKEDDQRRLRYYNFGVWGSTFFIGCVTSICKFPPIIPSTYYRSTLGHTSCTFEKNSSPFYNYYLPVGVSLMVNLATITWTFKFLRQSGPQFKTLFRKSFVLFLMMGLSWLTEILTWAFPEYIPTELLTGFDIFNASQGIIISLLFVCHKNLNYVEEDNKETSAERKGFGMNLLDRKQKVYNW
ncbi:probable G-protein coupled receptor Mth-like 11 [Ctenocephalides felis]|uniref:probable G-protein coupled receptor Mth-like 11 n=1 Tax=Ctenocephalides felis TaxID=7515 RepID=UPI000E6E5345|nr:probable G-protein coupled receptor Mth-like 11 [Ctenocephalides felis]